MTSTQEQPINELLLSAKKASTMLSGLHAEQRHSTIESMASMIEQRTEEILNANREDLDKAEQMMEKGELTRSIVDRLKLDTFKIRGIVDGVRQVAGLPDPVGSISLARELDDGLKLYRVSAPIGVIAVIFESRPDVLPQIASLAIRSSNVAILKGGKEARRTNSVLFGCLQEALGETGLPPQSLILLHGREDVEMLLKADGLVDLIIPRGSNDLVRYIQDHTRIPVLGHADGLCHMYVHEDADIDMAVRLVVDSKVQYPAACNSIETLLVDATIAGAFLPLLAESLCQKNVELRLDQRSYDIVSLLQPSVMHADNNDWTTEYSDLVLSIKVVDSIVQAIDHINQFGSHHTDGIVTADADVYESFFRSVNSAGVYWNASTRFADGFRYGFGAEVGISTGKLHPRGPVGLEGLVTYKYKLVGKGHVVSDYLGPSAKRFIHRDIDM